MTTRLRQLYNTADRFFDRRSITEDIGLTRPAGELRQPQTARQAWEKVRPVAREFDRRARLKMVVSQPGLDHRGASHHWEFFFDLPGRQAKLVGEWRLSWDEAGDHGPAVIEITVQPFPPADSQLRKLVQAGHLLYRQLGGLWRQEMKRRPDLPEDFRDSDIVLEDLIGQGLDTANQEFSLSTGLAPNGRLCWIAQARRRTFYTSLV